MTKGEKILIDEMLQDTEMMLIICEHNKKENEKLRIEMLEDLTEIMLEYYLKFTNNKVELSKKCVALELSVHSNKSMLDIYETIKLYKSALN